MTDIWPDTASLLEKAKLAIQLFYIASYYLLTSLIKLYENYLIKFLYFHIQ